MLTLTGLDNLQLLPDRPHRPTWIPTTASAQAGSMTRPPSGDTMTPASAPETVVLSENKDTTLHLLLRERAIAVEETGYAGAPWHRGPELDRPGHPPDLRG